MARVSASAFRDREMCAKEIDANSVDIDRMSFTIPMISLARVMPEIARTGIKLLENTSREANSKVIAMQRADLIAEASAISGDPIEDSTIDPLIGDSSLGPENTQPSPAASFSLFQAASVLHVTRLLTEMVCGDSRGRL